MKTYASQELTVESLSDLYRPAECLKSVVVECLLPFPSFGLLGESLILLVKQVRTLSERGSGCSFLSFWVVAGRVRSSLYDVYMEGPCRAW